MIRYSTVFEEGLAEQTIERSRFIAHVKPVSSKEEADAFIAAIKKQYKDATHNVPAMVIGDKFQVQWASDDGEPQGTSGAPIVQMLVLENITNIVVVVTRYFGGIKLGTGGLVRAYTSSAKLGIQAAGPCDVKELSAVTYRMDYSVFNKVQKLYFTYEVKFANIVYDDTVTCEIVMDPSCAGALKETVTSLSGGKAVIVNESVRLDKVRK